MRFRRRALLALPGLACPWLSAAPARAQASLVRIGGTGMALAAMRRVGERMAAIHPGQGAVMLPSLGTNGGLRALQASAIDLALLARPLRPNEVTHGVRSRPYARTPIAVVTNGGTAAGFTLQEVGAVLRGEIATWPDGTRLRVVRREASDADWQLLASLSPEMERSIAAALRRPGLVTVGTDQENADALQGIGGSFGLMSIGQLKAEGLRLRPLALDGVAPAMAAVETGRYALSRTLYAAWMANARPPVAPFLDFLAGEEARAILLGLGYGMPGP